MSLGFLIEILDLYILLFDPLNIIFDKLFKLPILSIQIPNVFLFFFKSHLMLPLHDSFLPFNSLNSLLQLPRFIGELEVNLFICLSANYFIKIAFLSISLFLNFSKLFYKFIHPLPSYSLPLVLASKGIFNSSQLLNDTTIVPWSLTYFREHGFSLFLSRDWRSNILIKFFTDLLVFENLFTLFRF